MIPPVVLDAAGLEALTESPVPQRLRAHLNRADARGAPVLVPAVVCAELCRGAARTRQVESAFARHRRANGEWPSVAVVDTDFDLARQVGAVLHGAGADTTDMVDAHVVAVCARHGGGLVLTADSDDIHRLAVAVPAARIVTRPPR